MTDHSRLHESIEQRFTTLERAVERDTRRPIPRRTRYNVFDYIPATEHAAIVAGTSSYDAAADIAAALAAAAGGIVEFGPGTYKVDAGQTLTDTISMLGHGSGATVLDFSAMTGTALSAAIQATGSTTALPALNADIALHALTITFASAPSVVAGDVLRLYDKENYSFSRARSYYRAGEFCQVKSVSGSVVTLTHPTYAAYSSTATTTTASLNATAGQIRVTAVKVNPVRVGISGMSMKFKVGYRGIRVTDGLNPTFDDLDLTGSDLSNLELKRCFDFNVSNVRIFDASPVTLYGGGVLNYGLMLSNTQHGIVGDCVLEATRHGMTLGGGSEDGDVSNRDIHISGGIITNGLTSYYFSATVNTTLDSNVLTAVSSFAGFDPGEAITGAGIPAGTTISSIDTTLLTITLDQAATATATGITISKTDSSGGVMGCNLHGNSERVRFGSVAMSRGYNPSGTDTQAIGCTIGSAGSGIAVYGSGNELLNWDHSLIGCTFNLTQHVSTNFAAVYLACGSVITGAQRPSGTFRFLNNVVNCGPYASMNRSDPDPNNWTVTTGLNMLQLVTSAGYANQKQVIRLTGAYTGGTFTLTYSGQTTAGIAYNTTAATAQAALEALSNIAPGDVTVVQDVASSQPWTVFLGGALVTATTTPAAMTASGAGLTPSGGVSIGASVTDHSVDIAGNTFTSDRKLGGGVYAIVVQAATAKAWKRVRIARNTLNGGAIWARGTNAEQVTIDGNDSDRSLSYGVRVDVNATDTGLPKRVSVRRNTIYRATNTGLYLNGNVATDTLECTDNTSLDNAIVPAGSSALDASAYLNGWLEATFHRNIAGDTKATTTQSRAYNFNNIGTLWEDANTILGTVTTINRTSITSEYAATTWNGIGRVVYGTAAPASGTWAAGDIVWNRTPTAGAVSAWICITAGTPGTWQPLSVLSTSAVLTANAFTDAQTITVTDAGTTNQALVATFIHGTSGTPAGGFGVNVAFQAHSSTNTIRNLAGFLPLWVTATDASRKARLSMFVYDTAAREVIRGEASGTAAMVGFLGAAAIARPAVTGSRGGNAALASALTALANLGLITDSSTA